MLSNRAPLIQVGQLFLNEGLNEYLIVTRNNQGQVSYAGAGFRGSLEDFDFIDKFPAVDPADVDPAELEELLSFCPPGTIASVGFIGEGSAEDDEDE
jgi:uncharacterized Fe-S cluster protein YjdI